MSDQQKPNNAAVNLYEVYNQELARMHDLMKAYMQMPKHPHGYGSTYAGSSSSHSDLGTFYHRIVELQNILIAALQSHDPLIQEKVAELALTGSIPTPGGDIPF